jgi:DMSO/TMAO reductase YedYZ molybdopterin-dependent catalytic subunit
MHSEFTRRDFLILVTGTTGFLMASCRPTNDSSVPIPTLVPDGYQPTQTQPSEENSSTSSGDSMDRTHAADFSKPDPLHNDSSYKRSTLLTPLESFYVQAYALLPDPPVDEQEWSLEISGLIEHPTTLTYQDVLNFEPVTVMRTLECIGNPVGGPLIGNTHWTGFRLQPLLKEIGIQSGVQRAKFIAADGYRTAVDLEWILQEDTLLVYAMDDQPLTNAHGYPLRIMIPGLYGQKQPKWITNIEFLDTRYQGYYEQYGWSDTAAVKTNSQIRLPEAFSTITGTFTLQGWAYAGNRAIEAVEVSINDGPWQPCDLLPGSSPLVWTQWWTTWTPDRTGAFTVAVRTTDDTGYVQWQPGNALDSAYPGGTDAIHSVAYNAQEPES